MSPDDRAWLGIQLIDVEPGTPKPGLWCGKCLLPSRCEIPVYTIVENGVTHIGTVSTCDGCGEVSL